MTGERWFARWPLALLLAAIAALYLPGFSGFWLGDDFPNLQQLYVFEQQQRLWQGTLEFFGGGLTEQGSFYRPMSIASLAANYVLAGAYYPGWFAVNLLVHLCNTALVFVLVLRLAGTTGRSVHTQALIAAAMFGLAPSLAEGVFWISARADGWVTALCLIGTLAWIGSDGRPHHRAWWLLPMFLLALLFKESAAVLPLQLALLAIAQPSPMSRAQRAALLASMLVVLLFFGARAVLFGNPWQVYAARDAVSTGLGVGGMAQAASSLWPWWRALAGAIPWSAIVYPALLLLSLLLAALSVRGAQRRMALALACASGGMVLATLLNLGGMPDTGEGGRLTYTPWAWLAAGFGVALAGAQQQPAISRVTLGVVAAAVLTGAVVLGGVLGGARNAQFQVHAITAALSPWAAGHSGLTLLIVPPRIGPVVATINAQAGLALPPLQARGQMHRVLPTLPDEIALRHAQLAAGLATRLAMLRPEFIDPSVLRGLLQPAAPQWPAHYACWSIAQSRMLQLPPPRVDDAIAWSEDLAVSSRAACGL